MLKRKNILSLSVGIILPAWLPISLLAASAHIDNLQVEPKEVVLTNANETAQILVTLRMSDGTVQDATHKANYTVVGANADTRVAAIRDAIVFPRHDGDSEIQVQVTDPATHKPLTAAVKVSVKNAAVERTVSFVNDVIPVLTKAGCNSGGCHGKQSGQNGFHLSLLGFEPNYDYDALVKEGRGRRVSVAAPEQSLLLLKAIGRTVHGGGRRLEPESDGYQMLLRWVKQGLPKPDANEAKVVGIEVLPNERLLAGSHEQQLRVLAHYTDGGVRDVTRQAEFKAQQPDILRVESTGTVSTTGHTGEGAVMVRYMGFVDVAKIGVPFNLNLSQNVYADFKPKTYIDHFVLEKWQKLGIAPSPLCSDEEFIRRASLDAIGTLPTTDEVTQFISNPSPNKRDELVDRLLDRNEYADYWAQLWGDLLRNKRRYGDDYKRGTFAFAAWIRDSFAQNKPYDQFVREILTAQGNVSDNPPVVWYREVRNINHQVNDTAQLFLGTRISCANCHHHPYERWSQDDYWGFAAFYSRLGTKNGEVSNEQAVFVRKDGDVYQPRSGKRMKPKGLGGQEFDYVRGEDPRQYMADWMARPDNPFFSKAIANRMWEHFMGVGLVEAVDDMRVTNPPSNPQLLTALAKDLVDHKFDLKALIKSVMKSQAYGLSATPTPLNATDRQNFARYTPKRMPAEVMLDAVSTVTGSQEKMPGFPQGTRAIEMPDEAVPSYFLDVFGRSQRESPCECERSYAPNLAQTLHLMNSPEIQSKIADGNGYVAQSIKGNKKDEQILDEMYLRALARHPHADELKDAVAIVSTAKDRKASLEDFEWMLLNSKEFLFNH